MKLPSSLLALKELARNKLLNLLAALFNNTDDALFERADRSRSDGDQQMYFESMRLLRLHRETLASTFISGVDAAFAALVQPHQREAVSPREPDYDSLKLVNQEELEISVAVAGIVSKVTSLHSLEFMLLTKRIDHLVSGMDVTERRNPLGPQVLGESFSRALDSVQLNITIRIILLKLFERCVMERLGELYAQANRQLADLGVLPELRRGSRPAARPATAAQGSPGMSPAPGSESGQMQDGGHLGGLDFGQISQLLGASRGIPGAFGKAAPMHTHGGSGTWISTDQLLGALDFLQSELPVSGLDEAVAPQTINLAQVLASRAARLGAPPDSSLRQVDDDVVTFVGMLFDYILNDRNLAIPMKALIARLQIPIVKLAILDKSFFSRPSHPARRLLNELSSAGIGWSSSSERKRDSLYNKIESVVAGVLEEFQTNPEIFARLLEDLTSFARQEKRRTESIEQRVRETEHGKARTYDAKRRAQNVINAKAAGLRLHPVMSRFISEVWSKVLVYACIKHGPESGSWTGCVENLDQLLWAIQPLNDLSDVDRRDRLRPALVQSLRAGMMLINLPAEEVVEQARLVERHLAEISTHDRGYLVDADPASRIEPSLEVIQEVILAPPADEPSVEEDPAVDPLLARLAEGMWVELQGSESERIRCKLATILNDGKRFIFVNRKGMKVAERSRSELGAELKAGTSSVLDDNQIFDKALQAVIGNLRQMREESSPRTRIA